MTETHTVKTQMFCRDCGKEIDEYVTVNREDGSHKCVCVSCAPSN